MTLAGRPPRVTRAVLLAHPAGHSLSPAMHDAAFAALGLDGRFEAWDVPPGGLADALERLRGSALLLGANVSLPHKERVLGALDEVSPVARRLGAVNTIVRRGCRLAGDNTDLLGLRKALAELERPPGAGRAVVLGAGGAARAAVAALLDAGCSVQLHNRDPGRAAALVEAWRGAGPVEVVDGSGLREAVERADWLVNTTTVGMLGGPPGSPLPDGLLPSAGAVVDLVYRPRPTQLLAAARAAGLPTQDGVAMLVHQGAASFLAWTGQQAPVEVMRAAVERSLAS
jgi:shikimate dehydrogenase